MGWIGVIASYLIYLGEKKLNPENRGLWKNIFMSPLFYLGLGWIYLGYKSYMINYVEGAVPQIGTGLIHFIFLIILIVGKMKKGKKK